MQVLLMLAMCSAVFAGRSPQHLSTFTEEQVQDLLTEWRLDQAFSKDFEQHGFDGLVLDVLDKDEAFDSSLFPNASPIFWKMLLRKIADFKNIHASVPRRSLKALDTSGYIGVRIRNKNAVVAMGPAQDVQLYRAGPKKLVISADVEITGKLKYAGGGGSGDVRIGNSASACTAANAGALRWEGNKKGLTVCDGKAFQPLKSFEGEFMSTAGVLYSQYQVGKNEGFLRDDIAYCINCPKPGSAVSSTDFRIGGGDAPFNFYGSCNGKCEISGDTSGNVKLDGSNGNDAVRSKKAVLKGDFEYGCTVDAGSGSHNRFGLGLWGENAVGQFKSGNSAGYCAQASKGNCYFCRFEGASCAFRGTYTASFGLHKNIHVQNSAFKFTRINGQICGYVKGAKQGCYSQKYTGDMYASIQNDGGSSRNLHKCYFKSLNSGPKGNFPFSTIKARNSDKSAITDFRLDTGALPPGMKLNAKTGMIYGKTKAVSKATRFEFSVKASGKNDPVTRAFSIEVRHRQSVDKRSSDFSIGSNKPFKYVGSCNSKCEIGTDSNGNIKLDGSNGNDAIIMNKPLLVGDFEYGCTVTDGTSSTTNRFGMGLWGQNAYSSFRSSNSAGYCAQTKTGNCYFCRFEGASCAWRGSYTKVFSLNNIHNKNAEFMFKRIGDTICGYTNDQKQGCYSQKTSGPMYGTVQNDGGSSKFMHKCYYKTVTGKITYV